jgi:PleD family two-component response regulator
MSIASPEELSYDPAMASPATGGRGAILIAEDEDGIRDSLTQVLTEEGYDVVATADGAAAIAAIGAREFDVVRRPAHARRRRARCPAPRARGMQTLVR